MNESFSRGSGWFRSINLLDYIANLRNDFTMEEMAFLTTKKVDAVFVLSLYTCSCQKRRDKLFGRKDNFIKQITKKPTKHWKCSYNKHNLQMQWNLLFCSVKKPFWKVFGHLWESSQWELVYVQIKLLIKVTILFDKCHLPSTSPPLPPLPPSYFTECTTPFFAIFNMKYRKEWR